MINALITCLFCFCREKKMKTDSEYKETQKEEQKCNTTFMQIIY